MNLAARLQSHADLGGILLAHETYALVKDEVIAEETGTITVKGFAGRCGRTAWWACTSNAGGRAASSGRSRTACS